MISNQLSAQLVDIGEGLQAQLCELARDPQPYRAERLALNLEATRLYVLRIREELLREGSGDER